MALAAKARGLSYIAITEHSKRLTVAHGLNEKQLLKQIDEIDKLNSNLKGITILKGIEVDILTDGSLDLPNRVLVSINTDAHALSDFDNLCYGVGQARRGWLEANDILNTRPLGALRKLLKQTM